MKRKLSYLIVSVLMGTAVLFPAVAIAQDSTSSGDTQSTTTTTSSSDDATAKVETETHDMTSRLTKFKDQFKVKLAVAEAARIKLKCTGAQKVVGTINTKFGNSITVRTQAYTELQKNLDKLVEKLKAKNVDTTTLESQITELKAKITTYNTDLTAYKQSLSDLKDVKCTDDPAAFQAALLAARSARQKLVTDVLAIRTYLVGTIKPTLQSIKKSLDSSSSDSKDSNSTTNTSTNSTSGGSSN